MARQANGTKHAKIEELAVKAEAVRQLLENVRRRKLAPESIEAAQRLAGEIVALTSGKVQLAVTLVYQIAQARARELGSLYVEAALRTVQDFLKLIQKGAIDAQR